MSNLRTHDNPDVLLMGLIVGENNHSQALSQQTGMDKQELLLKLVAGPLDLLSQGGCRGSCADPGETLLILAAGICPTALDGEP